MKSIAVAVPGIRGLKLTVGTFSKDSKENKQVQDGPEDLEAVVLEVANDDRVPLLGYRVWVFTLGLGLDTHALGTLRHGSTTAALGCSIGTFLARIRLTIPIMERED